MKKCGKCGSMSEDNASFCPNCGTVLDPVTNEKTEEVKNETVAFAAPATEEPKKQPEYDQADVKDNKIFAMLPYIAGLTGVIVSLIAAKDSKFTRFHVKNAVKLHIAQALLALAACLLYITIIVPIAASIAVIVLTVANYICFFQAASGNAKDPIIIGKIGLFK